MGCRRETESVGKMKRNIKPGLRWECWWGARRHAGSRLATGQVSQDAQRGLLGGGMKI